MKTLIVDIGGNSAKPAIHSRGKIEKLERLQRSKNEKLKPGHLVGHIMNLGVSYDHVVLGYPGVVKNGVIVAEPVNLKDGWKGYDFVSALGAPVSIVNDAEMQAIGSYQGKTMLFLGLGFGLGSCLIADYRVIPMELGHLPFKKNKSFEDFVGTEALERMKKAKREDKWEENVHETVNTLCKAMNADYVVLGGGNSKKMGKMPRLTRLGDNENAFTGGVIVANSKDYVETMIICRPKTKS